MKNFLFLILTIFIIFFGFTQKINAQAPSTNTFRCGNTARGCGILGNSCSPGYSPDSSQCVAIKDPTNCNVILPCVVNVGNVDIETDKALCTVNNKKGINTAIGCIPVEDTQAFLEFILFWAYGIAGGIAFLFIIYGSFVITTSSGDPKKSQTGKEVITSAIGGLMFLLLSVFLLRVVGIDILGISALGL